MSLWRSFSDRFVIGFGDCCSEFKEALYSQLSVRKGTGNHFAINAATGNKVYGDDAAARTTRLARCSAVQRGAVHGALAVLRDVTQRTILLACCMFLFDWESEVIVS